MELEPLVFKIVGIPEVKSFESREQENLYQGIHHTPPQVEYRGNGKWCVKWWSEVLSKSINEFVYESLPSGRTDEFIEDTRFDSKFDALDAFRQWYETKIGKE